MKTLRAIVLASIVALTGCTGFVPAIKHAVTGYEPTAEEKSRAGYDLTVAITNALILIAGYGTRYVQEKSVVKVKDPAK